MKRVYPKMIRWLAAPQSWLRSVVRRRRLEDEMELELAEHMECLTADLMRAGFSEKQAKRRARIALGSTVVHKDGMRASIGLRFWDELSGDLAYAVRRLRRSVGFTAIAAISLALAIGVTTSIFSLAKQILYERLAVERPAELRLLAWTGTRKHSPVHSIWGDYAPDGDGRVTSSSFSYPVYEQLKARNREMQLFAFKGIGGNATIAGQAEQVQGELVSGDYYSQLGVRPVLGRAIAASDERSTVAGAVTVISYGLWEREFGRSPGVLGQVVKLNDVSLTIVGVNPQSFTGAVSTMQSPDLFVPMIMQPLVRPNGAKPSLMDDNVEWWVNVMGRLRPGVSEAQAHAALDAQLAAASRATLTMKPDDDLPRIDLRDGSRGLFYQQRTYAKPMTVLLTMVGFVMLLACANIANLMLARGTERQREMSVRLALGAGRARIVRQLLVESLLLACVGGTGGLLLGALGAKLIPKLTEDGWSRNDFHIHFDWKIFAFTAAITLLTGILFGLAPAIAGSRARVSSGFSEGSQSVTRRRKGWAGKSLVGFQIALSTLLVIGAGLFLRTLASLEAVNVGFRTDHLLLAEVSLPEKQYPAGQDIAMHARILEAFAATPGVEAVTPAWVTYIADSMSRTDFVIEGQQTNKDSDDGEDFNIVGDNFFSLMQIPILAGRSFAITDTATSTRVGIINATLAKQRFGNQNPIGKRFSTGDAVDAHGGKLPTEWIQIVGVCADTRYNNLRDEPPAQFFTLFSQQKEVSGTLAYLFRTKGDPETVTPALRQVLHRLDPDLPMANVRTQQQQIAETTQQERIFVTLTSGFGTLALVLAAVGIYGVMGYSVANRTNEIGIRLALGALPRQVLRMILRESIWLSLVGVAVGLGAVLALARLVKSMLYGLQPADPMSLICGAALLIAVGLAASWIPARRAASVEPMEALRHE